MGRGQEQSWVGTRGGAKGRDRGRGGIRDGGRNVRQG